MTRRKKIIIACAVLAFLVLAGIFISRIGSKPDSNTSTDTKSQNDQPTGVTITNANDYATWFNTSNSPSIESGIYTQIKQYSKLSAPHYDATIRKNSLNTSYGPYLGPDGPPQIPSVGFIVDIPNASESYGVSITGGKGYPINILHISCPTANQLLYGDFGCKDPEQ